MDIQSTQEHEDHGSRVLLVNPADPNKPVAMMSRGRDVDHDERYKTFEAKEPLEMDFTPPEECMPPKN